VQKRRIFFYWNFYVEPEIGGLSAVSAAVAVGNYWRRRRPVLVVLRDEPLLFLRKPEAKSFRIDAGFFGLGEHIALTLPIPSS